MNKQKSNILIEENNHTLKELIHLLCHNLANPIGSLLELFNTNDLNKKIAVSLDENIDMIRNALHYSLNTIDAVRQMSSFEEKKIKGLLQSFRLKKLIQTSLSINHSKIEEKNIEIVCDIGYNVCIITDEMSFVNSVMNTLLTNAIKFSYPESKIFITVNERNDDVILSIKDHGIGIPKQILENIFRMDIPTAREGTMGESGTGFSMVLLKKFVNAYGGRIEIMSSAKASDHWTDVCLYLKKG
ncbi:GHKL domain protein [Candidatus Magnetomorum sp. HK-1]|nr:GHKL domain protein [Candidatus Magnetomorum sp. HK-1]